MDVVISLNWTGGPLLHRAVSYHTVKRCWVNELWVYERESSEFALVDVGDDQLVWRGQHGLRAGEEFVEVLRRFAALLKKGEKKDGGLFLDSIEKLALRPRENSFT